MNESMLNSLMRLFAMMASINREALNVVARSFVESYLSQQFSNKLALKYLGKYDDYSTDLHTPEDKTRSKQISSLSVKILAICQQIVEELHIRHRFQILLSLIQFTRYFEDSTGLSTGYKNAISDAVRTIAEGLLIRPDEYANCTAFILDKFYKVPDKDRLLVISDDRNFMFSEIRHLQKDRLHGQIFVLRIMQADIYLFQFAGKERLELNGRYIFPRYVYLFPKGGSIKGVSVSPVYYSDVVAGFIRQHGLQPVKFVADRVEFRFRNSDNGIHPFSFSGQSGQIIGVMGGSGTGKSTLLKVLNGTHKLAGGSILVNGHDLHKDARELEGMIGYIPQDDLLQDELTVYQNMYYNALLCLDGYSAAKLHEVIDRILKELDLYDARNLKVGNPLNKFISGGQRKRLNIALELIREPYILFVDEPTSGLSSVDSENVMVLLKEQAMKGKLVFVNIHQPSSDLFKLFDQLVVLDRGGYPVYSGNPVDGIGYFKTLADRVDAGEGECPSCGNINPEEILQVIEARDVDEYGEFTQKRRIQPDQWYRYYLEKIQNSLKFEIEKTIIPDKLFKVPDSIRQFAIFFSRNLRSKLADRQFMIISLSVAPLLAVILGYFTKYNSGTSRDPHEYVFSQNENLPAYLFMSVIVALFLGLILSAEEIIKDRKILERESFLHLSRTSYLLSKVAFLFLLSAVQMFLFVLIGNAILEIRGMTPTYWLILFVTSCFANMIGLNISDGLKSVVAIYIAVPFLLVPQILLAGVIVKWDKLHYSFASQEAVPVVGDLMAARWSYEALAVGQYVGNDYQKHFIDLEMRESNLTYDRQFLVPALINTISDARLILLSDPENPELPVMLARIRDGFQDIFLTGSYKYEDQLVPGRFSETTAENTLEWLRDYERRLVSSFREISNEKDERIEELREELGGAAAVLNLKRKYHNESLADLVLNRMDMHKIVVIDNRFIRKMEPVYMYPVLANGRAQFFASVKRIGNFYMSAVSFNTFALVLMTLVFYLTLQFSLLRKGLDWLGGQRVLRVKRK